MDTDYGLPILTNRRFIDMDLTADYDSILPFRKNLKQVTEVSVENSEPYQLSKAHRLSRLEQLPLEIRHIIYGFFDDLWRTQPASSTKHFNFRNHYCMWPQSLTRNNAENSGGGGGLLCVNREIRAEILGLMLRDAVVAFHHPLSNKAIFRNNWQKFYGIYPTAPPKLERTRLACSTFHFIRHLRLETMADCRYAVERPHSWVVSRKRRHHYLALLASSIKFAAKYCPNLVTLHVNPVGRAKSLVKGIQQAAFTPVVVALKELVEKCPNIEVVGMIGSTSDDQDLSLGHISVYARVEAIEQWCRQSVGDMITHNQITEVATEIPDDGQYCW